MCRDRSWNQTCQRANCPSDGGKAPSAFQVVACRSTRKTMFREANKWLMSGSDLTKLGPLRFGRATTKGAVRHQRPPIGFPCCDRRDLEGEAPARAAAAARREPARPATYRYTRLETVSNHPTTSSTWSRSFFRGGAGSPAIGLHLTMVKCGRKRQSRPALPQRPLAPGIASDPITLTKFRPHAAPPDRGR